MGTPSAAPHYREDGLKLYEGMFLLNSVEAKRDWDGLLGHVKGLLTKHGAEILQDVLWDDRKLAYEVAGQKRGTYLLVFFKLDPLALAAMRRDCELSEQILRQLFIVHAGDQVPVFAVAPEGHGEELGESRSEGRYRERRPEYGRDREDGPPRSDRRPPVSRESDGASGRGSE